MESTTIPSVLGKHSQPSSTVTPSIPLPLCRWAGCTASFVTIQELVAHISEEHTPTTFTGPYTCAWTNCEHKRQRFPTRFALLAHLQQHTGERPFHCTFPECSKTYKRPDALARHVIRHDAGPQETIEPSAESDVDNPAYANKTTRKRVRRSAGSPPPSTDQDKWTLASALSVRRGRPKRKVSDVATEGPPTSGTKISTPSGRKVKGGTRTVGPFDIDPNQPFPTKLTPEQFGAGREYAFFRSTERHVANLQERIMSSRQEYIHLRRKYKLLNILKKCYLDAYLEQSQSDLWASDTLPYSSDSDAL
ncbi:hypothetical protein IWQ61_003305 [Dispira simplex]|nr:hypothetical protein IWQ61_003305 [Dispira simplex]